MSYYLEFTVLGLDFLKTRLLGEDLIPSQLPLREGLEEKLRTLHTIGIQTLSDINILLKKESSMITLSNETGIQLDYLKLLARVLRGYTPKTVMLSDLPLVGAEVLKTLMEHGIRDSYSLWTAAARMKDRATLAKETDLPPTVLCSIACLSDLCRIQWVSPLFSRLIFDAGFKTVQEVANARAEDLVNGVSTVNKEENLFKSKIGARDMGRLVYLASLLPHELEL